MPLMAEIRLPRVDQGQGKIRTVPIAVTPEGFWCCPSPAVFQKTQKAQTPLNKLKPSQSTHNPASLSKKQSMETQRKLETVSSMADQVNDEATTQNHTVNVVNPSSNKKPARKKLENAPKKFTIEFGEPGTSDLKLILLGNHGATVKLSVHRSVLMENSVSFAEKISNQQPVFPCMEVDDCEDVDIFIETIGLMYCKDLRPRLIKQSVSRVLRILKISEQIGFSMCIESCLEYLEAVPWVGEEEEEKVVSSVMHLEGEGIRAKPVLNRVASDLSKPPKDTLSHVFELVLKSREERARREMKSIVLKLLKESNSNDLCNDLLYSSCRSCLHSLLSLFRQALETETTTASDVMKMMVLESDNLLWLLDILVGRQAADEFAVIWANQRELASLHSELPVPTRHHVSSITSRLFVGIGRGELLPSKDTRHLLVQKWLQPLIEDYKWLRNGCRSFDRNAVEEGLGRTILTLPLDDQQSILLSWLGRFLESGDDCPNLRGAFEVWWRRTFIRPYMELGSLRMADEVTRSESMSNVME